MKARKINKQNGIKATSIKNIIRVLVGDISKINVDNLAIPKNFIKNQYSKVEYYLLEKGLKKYYGITDFEIKYNNGKPYIKDRDIHISISHDKNLVLCVLSDKAVGCDIQFYPEKKINSKMKEFLNLDKNITDQDFVKIFSKKEAVTKLHGKPFTSLNDYKLNNYDYVVFEKKEYIIVIVY